MVRTDNGTAGAGDLVGVRTNGDNFIFLRPQSSSASGSQLTVILVQHWLTDLARRLKR